MPASRVKGKETSIPFHALEKCPWNTKKPIHGAYKGGLRTSLEYFSLRDRIRVWPVPKRKGHFYILDGNQRIDEIREILEAELIAEHFGISYNELGVLPPGAVKEVKADESNGAVLQQIETRILQSQIDVLILDDLDQQDAILFNATFNRNHAVPDEAKVVTSLELANQHAKNLKDDVLSQQKQLINRMLRPEKGLINPLPPPATPFVGSEPPKREPISEFKPSNDVEAKYGPPPPEPPHTEAKPPPALIPLILSLTQEGYHQITSTTLKLTAKLYQQQKLIEALDQLDKAVVKKGKGYDLDSVTMEIALLTIHRHTEVIDQ